MNMFENIEAMMKMKKAWTTFNNNHPKFAQFLTQVGRAGAPEGTIIEIHMEYPDGRTLSANMRVLPEDIELIESLKNIRK